ncbi:MAG: deoxyribose-phosphate aldolase [Actinomycetota bacterium]|nr:deoxyribose-phosphate aldolase [Actinomycetota bacterium]
MSETKLPEAAERRAEDAVPPDLNSLDAEELKKRIDQTLLKPNATMESFQKFLKESAEAGFGCVFVPPAYVRDASRALSGTGSKVGTPISFPFGFESSKTKVYEALNALEDGAEELDMVMNISYALSARWDLVEEELREVGMEVGKWGESKRRDHVVLKVIIEAPYLSDNAKVEACRRAAAAGMDYVKTATGVGPGGATVHDVKIMRKSVGTRLGVKAAGGIRNWSEARSMFAAGASRIGTSAGREILESFFERAG